MTSFERQRLDRYITDAGDWLTQIEKILFKAKTPSQAAASDFIQAAHESVDAARK
ncbi:hypothetical protein Ga0466249_004330 [Sporomusaceae bacterium BoRhaA]|uniref:hypothetical protein n=1 Tax=Pelorhabdus rhamnosifermentans TaxID=2772457 RepID=UPI001C05EF76|nr:hypothetical protein [Pelorhabdus rhamnosifermentans]MBU2703194.1 hypothetical protein [Pelorhabdus rhamnosifermentans]